jgi:hypothetical protein
MARHNIPPIKDLGEPIFAVPGSEPPQDDRQPIPKFLTNAAKADAPSDYSNAVRKGLLSELESELSKGQREINMQARELRQQANQASEPEDWRNRTRPSNWNQGDDPVNAIAAQTLDMKYRDLKRWAEALARISDQKQDFVWWVDVLHRWALDEFEKSDLSYIDKGLAAAETRLKADAK